MQKTNYKLEGDIDFFAELQKSLLEEELDEGEGEGGEPVPTCQITGLPLTENHFKMNCGHMFNYASLYTEICKQKFEFKTYTMDSISTTDIRLFRTQGFDYFIKCPYCRRIQTALLPYYENLPFPKKYGVNTTDTAFKVMETSSSESYTYKVYGYIFEKGVCCVSLSETQNVKCFNSWVSEIPGLCKSYCPNHIRAVSKEYKLLEKEKTIKNKAAAKALAKDALAKDSLAKAEAKSLAKAEAKALAKAEAKALAKDTKDTLKKVKLENKIISKKTGTIAVFVPESDEPKCSALIKSGPKKGAECGLKCVQNGFCGRHANK
jgi:hypothetical protein